MKKIKGLFSLIISVIKIFVFYLQIHSIIFKLADIFYFDKRIFHIIVTYLLIIYISYCFKLKDTLVSGGDWLRGGSKHCFPQEVADSRVSGSHLCPLNLDCSSVRKSWKPNLKLKQNFAPPEEQRHLSSVSIAGLQVTWEVVTCENWLLKFRQNLTMLTF